MRFDDAHEWAGDALPEGESAQFQQGKYEALLKLVPYARAGTREAVAVVLKLDGSEFDFAVGEVDLVDSRIPRSEAVAHLHSHPDEWPQGEKDWSNFLNTESVEQVHVIAPDSIYSLHKPIDWKPTSYGLEEVRASDIKGEEEAAKQRNQARVFTLYSQITAVGYEREGGWSRAAEIRGAIL